MNTSMGSAGEGMYLQQMGQSQQLHHNNGGGEGGGNGGGLDDRTALISAKLKQIYTKSILPVEKKYRYDYFFESPLLSDVEFDGTFFFKFVFCFVCVCVSLLCTRVRRFVSFRKTGSRFFCRRHQI